MARDTLYSGITLEDLPKEGEVIHLEGYISKLDGGTLVITEMDTLRWSIAAWAQIDVQETETVVILDESYGLFSVTVKNLVWWRTEKHGGNHPDIYQAMTTVVKYNTRAEHQKYYSG
jgi:hypothetical protein